IGDTEKQASLAFVYLPFFQTLLNDCGQVQETDGVGNAFAAFTKAGRYLPLGEGKLVLKPGEGSGGFYWRKVLALQILYYRELKLFAAGTDSAEKGWDPGQAGQFCGHKPPLSGDKLIFHIASVFCFFLNF